MAVLDKLLNVIIEMTSKLDELVESGYDLNDWRTFMAVLHVLQLQAQALIDLCQRLLANVGLSGEGYKDTVRKLREKGFLDVNEERFINSVIGFRNITVHEYMIVDLDIVEKILEKKEYRKILEIALKLKDRAGNYWDP